MDASGWLRLGALWERAGQPGHADEAYQAARQRLDAEGAPLRVHAARHGQVDLAFWVGKQVAMVRRVQSVDYRLHDLDRLELWSLDDSTDPLWSEYILQVRDWFHDGTHVAYSAGGQGLVRHDLSTFESETILGAPYGYLAVRTRADGSPWIVRAVGEWVFLFSGDRDVGAFELHGTTHGVALASSPGRAGGCQPVPYQHQTTAAMADVSPDGRFVAIAGTDDRIRIFDRTEAKKVDPVVPTFMSRWERPRALRFLPDSEALRAVFERGQIVTWRARDGAVIGAHSGGCTTSEEEDWRRVFWYERDPELDECAMTEQAAFSPDAELVATAGHDSLRIRNAGTGKSLAFEAGGFGHDSMSWSADGKLVFAPISTGEATRVWSSARGWAPFLTVRETGFGAMVRMHANRFDVQVRGGAVRWDMKTREGHRVRAAYGGKSDAYHLHTVLNPDVVVVEELSPNRLKIETNNDARTVLATMYGLRSGGWVAMTPNGELDGTQDAIEHLVVVAGDPPRVVAPAHFLWEGRSAPGLIAHALTRTR